MPDDLKELDPEPWTATFREWILETPKNGTSIAKNPEGPFLVEVFYDTYRSNPDWRCCLLPTRQRIGNKGYKTLEEAKSYVASKFRLISVPWTKKPWVPPPSQQQIWEGVALAKPVEKDPWD